MTAPNLPACIMFVTDCLRGEAKPGALRSFHESYVIHRADMLIKAQNTVILGATTGQIEVCRAVARSVA
jgi:hypothetical protein